MIGARVVVALPAEARPLISHWGLRRDPAGTAFPVYDGQDLAMVVSGVGKTAAAAATGWLAAARPPAPIWLNLGVAGHPSLEPGCARIAHRIEDASTQHRWYPPQVCAAPCAGDALRSEDSPREQFRHSCLHDMEAAAFYPAACRFTTAELVQCLKIVSDNGGVQMRTLPARAVEALVAAQLETIDALLNALRALAGVLPSSDDIEHRAQHFFKRWHFSVTQRRQLERLLRRSAILHPGTEPLDRELTVCVDGAQVLETLESRLVRAPVRFAPKGK